MDYLHNVRWPNGFVCPDCGEGGVWYDEREIYKCHNGHWISLTCGTVMHRTRTPLTTWFYCAWMLCTHKPGVSAHQAAERFIDAPGLTGIWGTLHKLRADMTAPGRNKLRGFVEVDEMYVGGEEHGPGRAGRGAVTKALVMVATEVLPWTDEHNGKEYTKAGRCRMRIVPNATAATCLRFLQDNIERGSTVSTDAHSGYNRAWMYGFRHEVTIAHETETPLPTLGRVTTNLTRWLIGTHKWAVTKRHLQAYLNEYCFRFNRRFNPWKGFNQLLGLLGTLNNRVEYRALWSGEYRAINPAPDGTDDYADHQLELFEDPRPVMKRLRAARGGITAAHVLLPHVEPIEEEISDPAPKVACAPTKARVYPKRVRR